MTSALHLRKFPADFPVSGQQESLSHQELLKFIEEVSGRSIELKLNRNRVSFVSFAEKTPGGAVRVRLQRAFAAAPPTVLRSLARWIASCRGRCPAPVRRFIDQQSVNSQPGRRISPAKINTRGETYDLAEIFSEINHEYFKGRLAVPITWGSRSSIKKRVRQRQLGSWNRSQGLIRISPVLDQVKIPRFIVSFVVFHEMLHAVQPPGGGHDREFRAVEKMHPDFLRYIAWQKRNINLLMRPAKASSRKQKQGPPQKTSGQGLLFF
jgi:hypothetical protein